MSTPMVTAHPPLRVALVEDDRIEAERAIAALRSAGHEVEWFTEGVQFMSEVREARHELFLFDWHLPDTEGTALVGWVHRSVGRRAPIIIFSRFDDDERIVEALAVGADDYIIKPTSATVLLARIAAVTRRFQGTTTAPCWWSSARTGSTAPRVNSRVTGSASSCSPRNSTWPGTCSCIATGWCVAGWWPRSGAGTSAVRRARSTPTSTPCVAS